MAQSKKRRTGIEETVKLIQQTDSGELLRVLEFGIKEIIEAELSALLGAGPYERSENRITHRNGVRSRRNVLSTGLGPVEIGIPKLRRGSFYPSILDQYKRIDRALISIITEAYINGVSTRKMNKIFSDLGLSGIDRSLVSRCASKMDSEIEAWKNRVLEKHYAYIWLDAVYTKIRLENRVVSTAVLIALGVRSDGYRDVLGLHLGNRESKTNWKEFLQSLKGRGLERCELWIGDDHDGLVKSIEECFPGQLRQRCMVHWMRNAGNKVAKSDLVWLLPLLKDVVGSKSRASFDIAWQNLIRSVESKGKERLLDWLDSTFHEITAYLSFPPEHWSRIKSTNVLERLNGEIRRRERCIRIFPDENSCIRLLGAILQDYSEEWTSNRVYFTRPLDKIEEHRLEMITVKAETGVMLKTCSA